MIKPQHTPRARSRAGILPVLVLAAVCGAVIMACGGSSSANTGTTTTSTSSSTNSTSTQSNAPQRFKVGDQVKVGSTYVVTVNSFTTNQGDDVFKPKDGNTFVIADVTIKNVSSQEQNVSSVLNFDFKDSTGQKYDETVVSGATPPDGKVAAGDQVRGQLAYEVPASQHNFTLSFQADLLSSGQTMWNLSV